MGIPRTHRRSIGETLLDEGVVNKEDLDEALRIQRKTRETLATILVDMGCCLDSDITKTICLQYQLPYICLNNYEVDPKLVELFPKEFLHDHKLVPFDRIGEMLLCVVTEIPGDDVLKEIPSTTRLKAALYVGTLSEVNEYLDKHCPVEKKKTPQKNRKPATAAARKKIDPNKSMIFDGESSEALLQALDSKWESIFDSGDDAAGTEVDEDDDA